MWCSLSPRLAGTRAHTMVEAINGVQEQLTEGLDCQFISHDGSFFHQDNTIGETMFDEGGFYLGRYFYLYLLCLIYIKYTVIVPVCSCK